MQEMIQKRLDDPRSGAACTFIMRRSRCAASLDHLVGEGEQHCGNFETKRPSRFEIDDEFKFD
jgi:hypothetical protein